jgi:replicative DNA helicase
MVKKRKGLELMDNLLEEDVIAYILEHPHSIIDAKKIISKDTFTQDLLGASYLACVTLSAEKGTFNRYDVFRWLKSKESEFGIDATRILTMLPKRTFNLPAVCAELKELETKRNISEMVLAVESKLTAGAEVSDLMQTLDNGMAKLTDEAVSEEVTTIGSVYDKVIAQLETNAGNLKFSGIDTGSRKLNYALGGWQEGISIIAARPGMGKTIAGLEHAKHACLSGKRVLFLSLEMPKESLLYRYISSEISEYNYSDLKANRITQEDVKKIKASKAKMLKELPLFFYDSDNRDVNYLSMLLAGECRKNKIDMVVVDYLQLIRDVQIKDQSDFAQVSSVSNKMQKLSRKLGIPIICLSQLSRDIEKRTSRVPQLSDLRSSGNIEQDAIVVIGLYRDDYYKYVDAKASGQAVAPMDNTLKYTILKNRDGNVGDIVRYVDVKTNRIADDESELFRFVESGITYQDSQINKIKVDFDAGVSIQPF